MQSERLRNKGHNLQQDGQALKQGSREVMGPPSLEVFRDWQNMALSNLI